MIGKKRKESSDDGAASADDASQSQEEPTNHQVGGGPALVRAPPPPPPPQEGWAPQYQYQHQQGGAMPPHPGGYSSGGPFRPPGERPIVMPPYPQAQAHQQPMPMPMPMPNSGGWRNGGGYPPSQQPPLVPYQAAARPFYPQHGGGAMPQWHHGGYSRPFRPSTELHQADQPTLSPPQGDIYPPGVPYRPPTIAPYQATPTMVNQVGQLSLQSQGTSIQPIQPGVGSATQRIPLPSQGTLTQTTHSVKMSTEQPPLPAQGSTAQEQPSLPAQGTTPQAIHPVQASTQHLPLPSQGATTQPMQPIETSTKQLTLLSEETTTTQPIATSTEKLPLPPQGTAPHAIKPVVALTKKLSLPSQGTSTQAIQPLPTSSQSVRFPLRPGTGTLGTKCIVKANHFLAEVPDKDIHHYDVSIIPEVTSRDVNRAIMKKLVSKYKESHLGKRLPAYDGRKSLYTAGPLPFTSKEFSITLVDEEDGTGGSRRKKQFRVVIKIAALADLNHLRLFLQGKQSDLPHQALQILDIILQQLPTSRYCHFGRSFYSPNLGRRQSLGDGLESWRGFYQTFRPTQMGLSLNIDMSSTAFMEPLPVIEFVSELLNRDVVSRPLSDADRMKVKKALRGVQVKVTHRGKKGRKYRICGISSQTPRELIFSVDERGSMKSVDQYFEETYGFILKHTALPCLQVGTPQRPSYLPMEVCQIVEGQRYSERLNERQITALLKVSCQRPYDREVDILETVRHNAYHNDPYAEEFGIKISENLVSVEARVLPPPMLKYHDTGRERDCLPHIGQWSMMNKKLINGGTVNNWMCINFSSKVQENDANRFCENLAQICHSSGMVFNLKPVLPTCKARPDQAEKALKTLYHDRLSKLQSPRKELDLLIVILPDNNGSLYGELKRVCETNLGLVTQCCLTKNVFKFSKQYLASLALKINVKVGGRNTALVDALSRRIPLVSDRPTIIFGADVTHPNPGEHSSPSIAAVVASQDWPEVTKYAGLVSAQSHREELIQDLYTVGRDSSRSGGMIKELFISFRRATGQKPERIIFYRDGVSEGQFYQVLLHELDAIRKACASLEPDYQPPVTFVVVQKRHHTRLFADNHADRRSVDRSGNILPGTVVDTMICRPTEFDFYLCSHAGIQGTSCPVHYHVIWDENKFTADGLQSLTNNLCYTYVRCTRSVSIVPPVYYAHLAAFRARCYMEPENSDSGSRGGGSGTRSKRTQNLNTAVKPLPALKENVKKVMFYC